MKSFPPNFHPLTTNGGSHRLAGIGGGGYRKRIVDPPLSQSRWRTAWPCGRAERRPMLQKDCRDGVPAVLNNQWRVRCDCGTPSRETNAVPTCLWSLGRPGCPDPTDLALDDSVPAGLMYLSTQTAQSSVRAMAAVLGPLFGCICETISEAGIRIPRRRGFKPQRRDDGCKIA
jgi:hypothetical protein